MSGFQPEFDLPRLRGEDAERMVSQMRSAILVGAIEVKRDDKARETGNAYFEYACRSKVDGEYHPSGLATTEATTWAHCIDGMVIFAPVWVLRLIVKQYGTKRECVYGGNPTRGLTVPLSRLLLAAVAVMNAPIDEKEAA